MRFSFILPALVPAVLAFCPPAFAQNAACFYEHAGFQGRRICVGVGQNIPLLDPSMNDQLSSVQIPPGVRVTMCQDANFQGRCIPLDRSVVNFQDLNFNDRVSSIAVDGGFAGGPGPMGPGGPGPMGPGGPGPMGPGGPMMGPGGPPMPPPGPQYSGPPRGWDDQREQMMEYRAACDAGDRRACVQFGITLGRNWERRAQWRQSNPDFFWWER